MPISSEGRMSPKELESRLEKFPRFNLAFLPTPMEKLNAVSRELGAINLYIKRDDQTGLAMGGNKTRKLDFIIGDALSLGATSFITWAGIQSNWCRQSAAASRKAGLKPLLVLFRRPWLPSEVDGNLLLDLLLGAEVRIVDLKKGDSFDELKDVEEIISRAADDERRAGRNPYIASVGGSYVEGSMRQPFGALGYTSGLVEIMRQAAGMDLAVDYVVLATGSGGTQAGLEVAARLAFPGVKIVGVSVGDDRQTMQTFISRVATQTMKALGVDEVVAPETVEVIDGYVGEGYGLVTQASAKAIQTVAGSEGILLDPVYTGKAMAGLLELVDQGYFRPGSNVVFLHSGGMPLLFPYRDTVLELASGK